MKCPRCGNTDERYFGEVHGRKYCRKCIEFNRVFLDQKPSYPKEKIHRLCIKYTLPFTLSKRQQEISNQLVVNFESGTNTIVMAVCGSGKTEMTYAVIAHVLNLGKRVCFSLPRKALVEELYARIVSAFEGIDIGMLYGGKLLNQDAPLVICTAHQLYRFVDKPFDLILMDEADAFPFYGDEVLNAIFYKCTKGTYIKMSATLVLSDIHNEQVLVMNRRYHNHDLPVPSIKKVPRFLWSYFLIKTITRMHKEGKKVLLYVPHKKDLYYYCKKLHRFSIKGVSSSTKNINSYIDELRKGTLDALLTTTILERGITVDNAQAIVINASASIFDERTLMQIAGRVGRKPQHYTGEVILLDSTVSKEMKSCIETIEYLNRISA